MQSPVGRRHVATRRSRRNAAAASTDEPDVYGEMLDEAGVAEQEPRMQERPLKRRRRGSGDHSNFVARSEGAVRKGKLGNDIKAEDQDDDDLEDTEFQDVALPAPTVQTMERDSDEENADSDEDLQFEDVEFQAWLKGETTAPVQSGELELNLTAQQAATPSRKAVERRRPITKDERDRRVDIHKAHLLCLLSHVSRRNNWCNDATVQDYLRPHLTEKTIKFLTPGPHLSQFGRAESLKNGLQQAAAMWKSKFEITQRGLRRAMWADSVDHLKDYELPDDVESCLDRSDFREAANTLQGSRDVGAQLYCALLRSVGVRARLVCSLQALPFMSGGPILPKPKENKTPPKHSKREEDQNFVKRYQKMANSTNAGTSEKPTARRRLGHPNATNYDFEPTAPVPRARPAFDAPRRIRESTFPVYWVEVLDVGHQKWQPADPVVTHTFWKPKMLEPPITDKENSLSYAVAFEADGTAKDVTRRYAKAYTAKTRRQRIESAEEGGERWWRKAMKPFRNRFPDDLDQIEGIELAGVETREPMPRNVQDFKDHPIYALERHLRRNEVLMPDATPSGTVGAGSRAPLEKIYRRKDVRIARTEDKWYRMGRVIKPLEIPVKWLPKKTQNKNGRLEDDENDEADGLAGVPMYTTEQTEIYEPPRVRNGRVPRNKFGNIDVYVPSMVPSGGVHITHEHATRSACILGIDYAPALTGFQFKSRHGTAVLSGIVVARENEEGLRAVMAGLGELEREEEEERRRAGTLRMWRRFLMVLRIRERVWSGVGEGERREAERKVDVAMGEAEEEVESDDTEEYDVVLDDDDDYGGGGGFLAE